MFWEFYPHLLWETWVLGTIARCVFFQYQSVPSTQFEDIHFRLNRLIYHFISRRSVAIRTEQAVYGNTGSPKSNFVKYPNALSLASMHWLNVRDPLQAACNSNRTRCRPCVWLIRLCTRDQTWFASIMRVVHTRGRHERTSCFTHEENVSRRKCTT